MQHENLTQKDVIELVSYDPISGKAFWNKRDIKWFNGNNKNALNRCKSWNSQFAGKEITRTDKYGYCHPYLFNKQIFLHRLIWFRQTGEWPIQVDHINGDRLDNRWENLRNVTNSINCKNRKRAKNNKSGMTGVYWSNRDLIWLSLIRVEDKLIYLGSFSNFEEAVAARKAAEIEYGFHENHDRL